MAYQFKSRLSFLVCVCCAFTGLAARVNTDELQLNLQEEGSENAEYTQEKAGLGDDASITISFNESYMAATGTHGASVGRLVVNFPQETATISNQGFTSSPPRPWQNGMILGKADDYVWQMANEMGGGMPGMGAATSYFTFDHGASDLVLGDAMTTKSEYYRPEFEEVMYTPLGYNTNPMMSMQKMLREEQKESSLIFGGWHRDGYFLNQGGSKFRYVPRLRLKSSSGGFQQVGKRSQYQSATLERPSILDIDNLFAVKAVVPNNMRTSAMVNGDTMYQGGRGITPGSSWSGGGWNGGGGGRTGGGQVPGYNPNSQCYPKNELLDQAMSWLNRYCGRGNPGQEMCATMDECKRLKGRWKNKYCQGGHGCGCCKEIGMHSSFIEENQTETHASGMQPGYPNNGGMPSNNMMPGSMQPGYPNNGGMPPNNMQPGNMQPGYPNTGGMPPNNMQPGGMQPGGMQPGNMNGGMPHNMQPGGMQPGGMQPGGMQPGGMMPGYGGLPVEIKVQWLTPVLQKYRCVSVSPQYAKTGGQSLFIAMGWDTESGVQDLDLDLSLVPLDGKKNVLRNKMVWYQTKTPQHLRCYNDFAMRAFNDDRSGDQPGDDELVKLNLWCLNQHTDIEAVVVMVNIYAPAQLTWSQIDSAYMRIISGGREMSQYGNFFIHDAEAVRSFIRLSGNDLKTDPDLSMNGLAVGIFFRQKKTEPSPTGQYMGGGWAFAALMSGVTGRNAGMSIPHLQQRLHEVVYPANEHWDQTLEQQQASQSGAFGQAGMHGKGTLQNLIKSGELPCIASKKDMAALHMGSMTKEGLQKVIDDPKLPDYIKKIARAMLANSGLRNDMIELANGVDKMENVSSDAEREQIGKDITNPTNPGGNVVQEPTQEQNDEAIDDLDSLFDDM